MLGSHKNGVQRTLEEHEDVEAGEVAEQPVYVYGSSLFLFMFMLMGAKQ